jgi:hypothetical protein
MSAASRWSNKKRRGARALQDASRIPRSFEIPPGFGVRALCAAFVLASSFKALAADPPVDISKLPPATTKQVDYDQDIRPIFENACFRCHGPERPKSHFRLDQREAALKGGDDNPNGDIKVGDSANSPLIHYVARLVPDMEMPPPGKGDPLTPTQVGLLRAWIDQGISYGTTTNAPVIKFAMTTGLRSIWVSGDERKFREHNWQSEGWAGGLERLYLQDRMTNGVIVTTEARAIVDQNDYLLKLRFEKPDFGFVQGGFEQYRRYTDDTGISFSSYPFGAPSLGSDYAMDIGRSWIDIGLTLPNWPKMTLGYEHRYREGNESTLQYDFVSPDIAVDPDGHALLPTVRTIKEDVHIVKFDLDHEIKGVRIGDSFRGEFYNLDSTRERTGVTVAGARSGYNGAREVDREDHFQGANSFTLEKQVRKWLYLSGGYFYSRLDGGAEFDRALFVPVNPAAPSFLNEASTGILIDQDTHAFNVNSLLGPWDGFSFYAGFQNEWMRQHSIAGSEISQLLPAIPDPARSFSDLDRVDFNENFGVKYTKIPSTVLHADMRWQQEYIDQTEAYLEGAPDSDHDFMRDTDAKSFLQEYRGGLTVSPWTEVMFSADYRHRDKKTDYNHLLDFDYSAEPGNGYPAFITARDILTDTFEARLALIVVSWFRTTLKYQIVSTDYHTTTDPFDIGAGPQGGGRLLAGNYDARVYSINGTLTPWQRLRLSTTFSYSQSRILSGDNNNAQIVPYTGDIYSVLSSATFILSQKTDLNASYFFSKADYAQSNDPAGLPVGIAYDRHGALAGVTYRWKPTLSAKLQYGFFNYNEPTTQGSNNYTAHAVFASITYSLD